MKYLVPAALALLLGSSFATAQTQTPATSGPNNPAVNSPGHNNSATPVSGANSFTETQAKSRLERSGFTSISPLAKDDNGIWRGTASKDGKSQAVAVDFQGNIIANVQ